MSIARTLGHITFSPRPVVFQDYVLASYDAAGNTTAPAFNFDFDMFDFDGAPQPAILPSVSRLIRRPA
ncbi:hypothetical protein AAIH70_16465 [Neorhizobium sp. BT27B]|uniref:hypothetical protein n=1 Tax=Neorhizobium sp. BT27B TaxID=3142625 RepID=UPI003D270AB8